MKYAIDYYKNSFIGLYIRANDDVAIAPPDIQEDAVKKIEQNLGVEVVKTTICNTNLIGIYIALNNQGVVVPPQIEPHEKKALEEAGLNVVVLNTLYNANGNNILLNDKFALFNAQLTNSVEQKLDVLGVKAKKWTHGPFKTPGSCCVCNNKGVAIHYLINESDAKEIAQELDVENWERATVNKGVGFIAYGAVANNKGLVVGWETSAFEAGNVLNALGFEGDNDEDNS